MMTPLSVLRIAVVVLWVCNCFGAWVLLNDVHERRADVFDSFGDHARIAINVISALGPITITYAAVCLMLHPGVDDEDSLT